MLQFRAEHFVLHKHRNCNIFILWRTLFATIRGISNHYPGAQTGPGKKTKFFMDCSTFCYVCIRWSLKTGPSSGPSGINKMGMATLKPEGLTGKKLTKELARQYLKPGDIVNYGSHWAVYVGDERIIDMVNYSKPSYSNWTLRNNSASYWSSKVVKKIYRITEEAAASVDVSQIDSNYLNYYFKVR